mmetsp:Transcript_24647/g.68054  ORF Transcript_24647/g.68054 Transcript_24647/m.68054 type:complete len:220 (+) Transcript_24647:112-771(+)
MNYSRTPSIDGTLKCGGAERHGTEQHRCPDPCSEVSGFSNDSEKNRTKRSSSSSSSLSCANDGASNSECRLLCYGSFSLQSKARHGKARHGTILNIRPIVAPGCCCAFAIGTGCDGQGCRSRLRSRCSPPSARSVSSPTTTFSENCSWSGSCETCRPCRSERCRPRLPCGGRTSDARRIGGIGCGPARRPAGGGSWNSWIRGTGSDARRQRPKRSPQRR